MVTQTVARFTPTSNSLQSKKRPFFPSFPTKAHWEMLEKLDADCPPITPLEFLQKWQLTNSQLAQIIDHSQSSVSCYISNKVNPLKLVCQRLGFVDRLSRSRFDVLGVAQSFLMTFLGFLDGSGKVFCFGLHLFVISSLGCFALELYAASRLRRAAA